MSDGAGLWKLSLFPDQRPRRGTPLRVRVAAPLMSAPVTNCVYLTLTRLADEITGRECVTKSQIRRKSGFRHPGHATR
ncbi:hypothetical protein NKI91_30525 [Mesorhizobium sp. M0312]|uniref:hypothetical protein n=1 Tax=Mesorhizobium sp. M0312 TaxID=2956934 RepID=UPI003337A813